jgi:hypothetical protein
MNSMEPHVARSSKLVVFSKSMFSMTCSMLIVSGVASRFVLFTLAVSFCTSAVIIGILVTSVRSFITAVFSLNQSKACMDLVAYELLFVLGLHEPSNPSRSRGLLGLLSGTLRCASSRDEAAVR